MFVYRVMKTSGGKDREGLPKNKMDTNQMALVSYHLAFIAIKGYSRNKTFLLSERAALEM